MEHQSFSWMEKPERHDNRGQSDCYKSSVLRFYGVWNDTASLYGDKRYFALHYFLEDGTMEMIEHNPNNSGRMPGNFFLHRARVPKTLQPMALIGQSQEGDKTQNCWTEKDLRVGAEISIYSRKVFLYDCDEQTRIYYKSKYGMEFSPINVREPGKKTAPQLEAVPPKSTKNGGGDLVDTITSKTQSLELDKSHSSLEPQLRFFAKLDKMGDPVDRDRTFIISYFPADDTIEIFEPVTDNSGFRGGEFLQRQRIEKGDDNDLSDLYVGAVLPIFGHTFKISDADEFCYAYMEHLPQQFPKSDIKAIMEKIKTHLAGRIKGVTKMFEEKDSQGTNKVHPDDFRSILRHLMPDHDFMTDHELTTVMRFYGNRNDPTMSLEQLVTLARSLLQKVGYKMQEQTLQPLINTDKTHSGVLTSQEIYSTLRGCQLPLEAELLHSIITRMPAKDKRYINYKDLVHALAWEDQVGALHHPDRARYDCRLTSEVVPGIAEVKYKEFLKDAGGLAGHFP